MRRKQVWRYYCDYCSKGRCQATSIANHELHCTKNPNRQCGMCVIWGEHPTPPSIDVLKSALTKGLDSLLETAKNCPACTLAAIRQSDSTTDEFEWDYRAACEQFWKDLRIEQENEAQQQALAEMYGS